MNELVLGVNIALGQQPVAQCPAFDTNADGMVAVSELITAVNAALGSCPPTPSPSPSPVPPATDTPTGTPPATASPTPTVAATTTPSASPRATATATGAPSSISSATRTATPTTRPTDTPLPTPMASPTATATPSHKPTGTATAGPIELPTASAAFRDVARSTQAATHLVLGMLDWLRLIEQALQPPGATPCPAGGSVEERCDVFDGEAVHSLHFTSCASTTPSGHQLIRNGGIIRHISNPAFCTAGMIEENDTVIIDLDGLDIEERNGDDTVLAMVATLVAEQHVGRARCAGRDRDEVIDGTLSVVCAAAADTVSCPVGGLNVVLTPRHLGVERSSSPTAPCVRFSTTNGGLEVDDRRRGEHLRQVLESLSLSEQPSLENPQLREVTVAGTISADCVGSLVFGTQSRLLLDPEAASGCPVGGEIVLGRAAGGSEAPAKPMAALRAAPAGPPPGTFRQILFRAAGGQVYQVLQNDDTANGADALQLTTLVGSLGDSVATCTNTAGMSADPQAVTVVPGGQAFALASTARSAVIADASAPCFNRNADAGDGLVCIGADCTPACACPDGGDCHSFTLAEGTALGDAAPAARLAQNLATTCGGFASRDTYAFAESAPTIQRPLCAPPPAEGIALPVGSSLIVAYDTLPLEIFNAGAAGFPIDTDADNALCPDSTGTLSPGRAVSDTAAAPRVEFSAGAGAALDYDGDQQPDRHFASCDLPLRIECGPVNDPTPTPTVDPARPCGATVLPSASSLSIDDSIAGRANTSGEASCGWSGGGSRSPDRVFEYVAPADGQYDIRLTAQQFDPYLYVRDGSCLPAQRELACSQAGEASLHLTAGQRIAIIADGEDARTGAFSLSVRRRQPDLTVAALNVEPARVQTGESLTVTARVENRGDGDAAPFFVDFFLAQDPNGTRVVSPAPLRCAVNASLPAGADVVCDPSNDLAVPLVAAGEYFLVARVQANPDTPDEDEADNLRSQSVLIDPAPGVVLEQRAFRARDGTVYQIVQAVPLLISTDADEYRVTSLAASTGTVGICKTGDVTLGAPLHAAAATADLVDAESVRRTHILRPSSFGTPLFDDAGSGRLVIGSGNATIEVCAQAAGCPTGEPTQSILAADDGMPGGCVASLASGSFCDGASLPSTFAFGLPHAGAHCSDPTLTTVASAVCNAPPLDGFDLRAGEAVVFVHQPGRDAYEVGVGAFGITRDDANGPGCASGQVVAREALTTAVADVPVLEFVEREQAAAPSASAVSGDGRSVYVTDPTGLLEVFARDSQTGALSPLQRLRQGLAGVRGLAGAAAVAVSPDDANVYVGGDSTVAVFRRDLATGLLSVIEAHVDGQGGVDGIGGTTALALSPDGGHVYVTGSADNAIAVFRRDERSGTLTLREIQRNGLAGVSGLASPRGVGISPDGKNVYVASKTSGSVAVFARDTLSGALSFVEAHVDGVGGVSGLAGARFVGISSDGRHVYVGSDLGSAMGSAIAIFQRDLVNGRLTYLTSTSLGQYGQTESLLVSADGKNVYAAVRGPRVAGGGLQDGVAVLARDAGDGSLASLQTISGAKGTGGASSLSASPGGEHLYLTAASDGDVAVFARNQTSGALSLAETARDGFDGLVGSPFGVSPDGNYVYFVRTSTTGDAAFPPQSDDHVSPGALGVFGRDEMTGRLTFLDIRFNYDEFVDDGLAGTLSATLGPDGHYVYVVSASIGGPTPAFEDGALSAFRRDEMTGMLSLVEVNRSCMSSGVQPDRFKAAHTLGVSPDGRYVYATSDFFLAPPPPPTPPGFPGSPGASVPPPASIGFPQQAQPGILAFERDDSGLLNCVDRKVGLSPSSLTVSTDGGQLYAALVIYDRDAQGLLSPSAVESDDVGDVAGFSRVDAVRLSPDGHQVYAVSAVDSALAVFQRDPATGALTFVELQRDGVNGVDGLAGAIDLAVSPDGRFVYVIGRSESALAVFQRDPDPGTLHFVEVRRNGVNGVSGLVGADSIAVSPDSRHVYVGGQLQMAVFEVSE